MATFTVNMIDLPGNRYTITVPRDGTVQNLIDAIVSKTWYKFPLRGIRQRGSYSWLRPEQRLTNIQNLEQTDIFVVPQQGRMAMHPNNWRAAKQSLGNYFGNVGRRTRGAMYRNYVNRRDVMESAQAALPPNILEYEIAPFLQGGKRKTRKSKKSKRHTRRR